MRGIRLLTRPARRTAGGIGALLTAVAVALVPLPQGADQAQAAGTDSSARTLSGTKGPYDDFSGLSVTVHQTAHLRNQGVKVTWTGGKPTPQGAEYVNFLQIMQCWGDSPQGPDREQCDFGAVPSGGTTYMGGRVLPKGYDPHETEYTEPTATSYSPFVPFRPVEGDPTDSEYDNTYFGPNDSNAQPFLKTQSDGTGEAVFETQTAQQAPHLGCGAVVSGSPRSCWLVVVPRGSYEIEKVHNGDLDTSALSRTNWDRRMVFPLEFDPVGDTCAPDMPERRIIGSELLTDAMSSWQTVLCAGGDARFTFTQSGEERARSLITRPTATSPGMAVTVDPVESTTGGPAVVHAPLAVNGLAIGFLWEDSGKPVEWVRDLRLTPRLLAKALTQSYVTSVNFWSVDIPGPPAHLAGNPESIVRDPEFLELNPVMAGRAERSSVYGIVVPGENSDTNRLVWRYLQSDRDAREFLQGKPDPWGMKVNPYYAELDLGSVAPDHFPKADPTETTTTGADGISAVYTGAEVVPYAEHLHDAAQRVRRGYSGQTTDLVACPECGSGGKLTGERKPQGRRQVAGLVDAASADRLRLDIAALPNADGEYVKPTNASLLEAVGQMKDHSAVAGVKIPEPARAKGGAYPLTAVAYAAASVDRSAEERKDYARLIRYATGAGQAQGLVPGMLPPGYAPLPRAMRDRAAAAASALEAGAVTAPGTGQAGGGTGGAASGAGGAAGAADAAGGLSQTGAGTTGGAAAQGGDPSAGPQGTASPGGPAAESGQEKPVASSGALTPADILGAVRWVLLGVLVAGASAALAGPVMLRLSARRRPASAD
ncbi:hypothetical protein [Streptomyces sp. NBC_00059]|uniref:hypothetical protein n=1 Tax=Streptomyces sp. NBC_00059 TaxID=2975635 RepID=UPI00224D9271|nr:hypothetical protein [Streptomyces sp. NBC_00059]MCX5410512.1 hypothetical protein [Streptomyces sp. NBC_00059]